MTKNFDLPARQRALKSTLPRQISLFKRAFHYKTDRSEKGLETRFKLSIIKWRKISSMRKNAIEGFRLVFQINSIIENKRRLLRERNGLYQLKLLLYIIKLEF